MPSLQLKILMNIDSFNMNCMCIRSDKLVDHFPFQIFGSKWDVAVRFHIVRCALGDAKVSNKTNGLGYLENRDKILRTLSLCLIELCGWRVIDKLLTEMTLLYLHKISSVSSLCLPWGVEFFCTSCALGHDSSKDITLLGWLGSSGYNLITLLTLLLVLQLLLIIDFCCS